MEPGVRARRRALSRGTADRLNGVGEKSCKVEGGGQGAAPLAFPCPSLPCRAPVQKRNQRLPWLPNCAASFCRRKGLSDIVAAEAAAAT